MLLYRNDLSEDKIDSFEYEDENSRVTFALRNGLNMSEKFPISGSEEIEERESKEKEIEGKIGLNQNLKEKERIHWVKRNFVALVADFVDNLNYITIYSQ